MVHSLVAMKHAAFANSQSRMVLHCALLQGLTALHCAARDNNVDMVQALLTSGADVHAKSALVRHAQTL